MIGHKKMEEYVYGKDWRKCCQERVKVENNVKVELILWDGSSIKLFLYGLKGHPYYANIH